MIDSLSSQDTLRHVENFGLFGSWLWTLKTNLHVWSPGLYKILGISTSYKAELGLLKSLIHPDDRISFANAAEIAGGEMPPEQIFRIIRPDHTIRTLLCRSEMQFLPSGQPARLMATLVDISEIEQYRRSRAARIARDRAIFKNVQSFTSTTASYPFDNFSDEWVELVGLPREDLIQEPTLPIVKEQRKYWEKHICERLLSRQLLDITPSIVLSDSTVVRCRIVMVPMVDKIGRSIGWSNFVYPLNDQDRAQASLSDISDDQIEGKHIRAGRALLSWTMSDLAKASKLSLSTVRRLEDNEEKHGKRSKRCVIQTLRRFGIDIYINRNSEVALCYSKKK